MAINYMPKRTGVDIEPFRFWCQKILPLVYDDSISYYELLCKVVDYLNMTMQDVNTLNGDVTNMYTAFEQLQNYVNTYFDSLDVQEEINNKLDDMAESGELTELLEGTVVESVGDWLGEHITPTSPALDDTLTIENAAAEAKATGDRIDEVDFTDRIAKGEGTGGVVTGALIFNDISGNSATGDYATAEGEGTTASGYASHAEGYSTSSNMYAHSEGQQTSAGGTASHAEGKSTNALGDYAHAEGEGTLAYKRAQHVVGKFNVADTGDGVYGNYVEIVGNGESSLRSNARTLDWEGNEVVAGKITVGAQGSGDMDVVTKSYADAIDEKTLKIDEKADAIVCKNNGSTVEFDDGSNNTLLKANLSLPYDANGYSSVSLSQETANICSPNTLKNNIMTGIPNATLNETDKTIRYASTQAQNAVFFNNFETGKQYTFFIRLSQSTETLSTNLRVKYTDNTDRALTKPYTVADEELTVYFVSDASKSIDGLIAYNERGYTTIFYDKCGIMEGVWDEDDYQPSNTNTYTTNLTDFHGGEYDFVSGKIVSLYASDGTEQHVESVGTKHEIYTSKGYNKFTVVSGDVEVEYVADTKIYIDKIDAKTDELEERIDEIVIEESVEGIAVDKSGKIIIINDGSTNALKKAKLTLPYDANGYSSLTLKQTTANVCPPETLKTNIMTQIPNATLNETAQTIKYTGTQGSGKVFFDDFEGGEQYTFFVHLSQSTATTSTNMRIYYTDGTYTAFVKPYPIANQEFDIVFVTDESKSVDRWVGSNERGSTTIFYGKTGIMKGAWTLEDYQEAVDTTYVTNLTGFYGGEYDFISGKLVSAYASDGTAQYIESEVTKHDIETMKGYNYFECNNDGLEIRYVADTKMYIDGDKSSKEIVSTLYGYVLPENSPLLYNLQDEHVSLLQEALVQWMSEYGGDAHKIPYIITTDQHGTLNANSKGVFDAIDYAVNWDEISAIFNLGDTILDHWIDSPITTNPLERSQQYELAIQCMSSIPVSKQINVIGNHDTWYTGNVETSVAGTLPNLKYLNPYFKTNGLRTVREYDNSGNMVVYDDNYKVKYLVVADWDYSDRPSPNKLYYFINENHWRWIISELSTDCGYDIVIVSHIPVTMYGADAYDPVTQESITGTALYISYNDPNSAKVFGDRKNKLSGQITVNNTTIPYDFTNTNDRLLCCIAGHTHLNGVDNIDGLLCVCYNRFSVNTKRVHFGLIDRLNNQIKNWEVFGGDIPTKYVWTAPFNFS